eukprot:SAG31_NODE_1459_length_8254_cov_4.297854_3_plen_85_part_00
MLKQQQRSIYDNSLEVIHGEDRASSDDDEFYALLEDLSPRTDHPAWLLLPRQASALGAPTHPGEDLPIATVANSSKYSKNARRR